MRCAPTEAIEPTCDSAEATDSERSDELCKSLLIMLDEASTRSTSIEACIVIGKILSSLSADHDELSMLSKQWETINHSERAIRCRIPG